jgi:elongation factor P
MATIKTNEFKNGLKIIQDGVPYNIVSYEHVQPGKGQAFVRVNYRNLFTNRVLEKTFKSSETVEVAEVMELELQYLYNDGEFWHFMDSSSYEQYQADKKAVGENGVWLVEQDEAVVTLWNGNIISVEPANFVQLQVANTEPGLKGDTTGSVTKPATLSNGVIIQVPLFINQDEIIKIDTRDGSYSSRVKS